jgi:hypothetical protein
LVLLQVGPFGPSESSVLAARTRVSPPVSVLFSDWLARSELLTRYGTAPMG